MSKPERKSPLAGHFAPGHHGAIGGEPVTLREIVWDTVEIVARRGQQERLRTAARTGLGLELPAMGTSLGTARLKAFGIGPGNRMILAEPDAPGALVLRVTSVLAGSASVVETGHGQVLLKLSGQHARHVLNKGCRLDLHPRVFQPGRVARTIIAQIPVTLWQVDATPTFALAAPLTFARSFAHFLLAASAETGCIILPMTEN